MFLQTANKLVRNYTTDIGDGRHGILHGRTEIQNFSLSEIFFQHGKRNFISPCSHSNGDISRVKITCYFYMWRYHVFTKKFTWYFIGIYIIIILNTQEPLAWENSHHFVMPPLFIVQNDVWGTQPIRSTTQIWVVTRDQYGISTDIPQMPFCAETSSGVATPGLFSQAREAYRIL